MIKPLTSLRFFFAVMVFLSHLEFVGADSIHFKNLYEKIFHEGYIGVSFFFILSGFILAFNYKNKLITGQVRLKEFWVARIARIYPLHVITLLIAIPVSWPAFLHNGTEWIGKFSANLFLVQAFIPIKEVYFSFNGPSWSISDEMFFYGLFPFMIMIIFKQPHLKKWIYILLLCTPIAIQLSPEGLRHWFFYINPFTRIIDFCLGILLFELYEKKNWAPVFKTRISATLAEVISILLFIVFFIFHKDILQGHRFSWYYWIPMASIIFAFAYQNGVVSKIISYKIFVWLGEISFGFYLIHNLAIDYIILLNNRFLMISSGMALIFFIFCITVLASYVSYRMIEQPFSKFIKTKYKQIVFSDL